jgi:PiT family inorganic phosphate transporter
MPELALLVLVIGAAIGFGLVNGFNDAANSVAASIGSRAISPRNAIILAAFCNFAGAATGLKVAETIGRGILVSEAISYVTVIAGLVAVIIWGTIATRLGLPVSISHSFVTGLAAAGVAVVGWEAVIWGVLERIGVSVVAAPTLGFIGGFVLMIVLLWASRRSAPSGMRVVFSRLQWLTTAFLAYSHGKNDGQMPIGVIAMALIVYYEQIGQFGQAVTVWDEIALNGNLWWVIIVSALAISSGIAIGGWRVIRTVGVKITALQPIHGFATQASAATVIEIASRLGIPVSTTHCATAATMGVGATKRLSAVRWGVTRNIVLAWILTFPICGALGWVIASLLKIAF